MPRLTCYIVTKEKDLLVALLEHSLLHIENMHQKITENEWVSRSNWNEDLLLRNISEDN